MNKLTLQEFMDWHHHAEKIAEIPKPYPSIKYDRPISVYFVDINNRGEDETMFCLFDDKIYVGNPIHFPAPISYQDQRAIAKDMIDEFLSCSDFSDLDTKCVDSDAEDCDQCSKYHAEEDGCIGKLYSCPQHMNGWDKTEEKWNPLYGDKSQAYLDYLIQQFGNLLWKFDNFEKVKGLKKRLIQNIKERI